MDHWIYGAFLASIIDQGKHPADAIAENLRKFFESRVGFPSKTKDLFEMICNDTLEYFAQYSAAPTMRIVVSKFAQAYDVNQVQEFMSARACFDTIETSNPAFGPEFQFLLDQVTHYFQYQVIQLSTAQAAANAIKGMPPGDIFGDLKSALRKAQEVGINLVPTVFHNEADEIEQDYQRYLNARKNWGCLFGILELDQMTRGVRREELVLVYGSPGDGKSTFVENMAVDNSYALGNNVIYVSLEMSETKLRNDLSLIFANKLLQNPEVYGLPRTEVPILPMLNASALDTGELTDEQEDFYFNIALPHLKSGKNQIPGPNFGCPFGDIRIIAPKISMDVVELTARLDYEMTRHETDLIIIDYIALLEPLRTSKGVDWHTALGEIIKAIKRYALLRRVPIVSPFQVNRQGRQDAERKDKETNENKGYNLFVGSQSAEAEKSADLIVSVFRDDDLKASEDVLISCLKNRRGPEIAQFPATFQPQFKYFASKLEEASQLTDPFELVECDF